MDVIIVSVFVSSEVDRYLDLQSPHTKNSQIGILWRDISTRGPVDCYFVGVAM